jgi:2'-5' RNA ligase
MSDVGDWAEWQLNYLPGLFVIWPPHAVREAVNRLRAAYDPVSQLTIEAHITLSQPFLSMPKDKEWALLAQIVAGFEPFEIRYGPVDTFFPNPVIYLAIQPQESVLALRQALHDTGLFNLTLPYTEGFVPHMTITEGRSQRPMDKQLLAEIQTRAPSGTFLLSEIAHVVPDKHFQFETKKSLRLGASHSH